MWGNFSESLPGEKQIAGTGTGIWMQMMAITVVVHNCM
jgi:hypothetical protein